MKFHDPAPPLRLDASLEHWPIEGGFAISRGTKYQADVIVVSIAGEQAEGRGECVPYARYGETTKGVIGHVEEMAHDISSGMEREELVTAMKAGAARNAIDCALWDFEAKRSGISVAKRLGLDPLQPVRTAYTIGFAAPEEMAAQASKVAHYPLLKIKLGRDGNEDRLKAVRASAPDARLIVDANEAWSDTTIGPMMDLCANLGVELIEQPLPAGEDSILAKVEHLVPVCADESSHGHHDLQQILDRYDAVNIKLDKTGGLTEALAMVEEARKFGMKIMVGSMVATSLSMAPAFLLAQSADWADLDGPLLLSKDREPGMTYDGTIIMPPPPALWG